MVSKKPKTSLSEIVQAWINLKIKIVTFVLIANSAVLGTAVAYIRDKADLFEGPFAVKIAAFGIGFGAAALWIAYSFSNNYLTGEFEEVPEPKPIESKKQPPEWAVKFAARSKTMDFANKWFAFFILCSAMCLIASIGYLNGLVEGRLDCVAKHPGCEEILKK